MMPLRTCEVCGAQFTQGRGRPARRCPEHRRYGGAHQALRAATVDAAYGQPCARCGKPMVPGEPVHLDHRDGGRPDEYIGFSHASCNIAAGNRSPKRALSAVPAPPPVVKTYDPGPPRPGVEHHAACFCESMAWQAGVWPSQCW